MISTDIMQQPAAAGPVTGVTSCEQATENGGRYILQKLFILALKELEMTKWWSTQFNSTSKQHGLLVY